jgi:hypothetical protein
MEIDGKKRGFLSMIIDETVLPRQITDEQWFLNFLAQQ